MNWCFNSTEAQFTDVIGLQCISSYDMVDSNLKLLGNGATHLRDTGDIRYYLSARALSL